MIISRTALIVLSISFLAAASPVAPPPAWDSLAPVFHSAPQPAPLPISMGNWIYRFDEGQWTIEVVPDGTIADAFLLHNSAQRLASPSLAPAGEPIPEPATSTVACSGLVALIAAVHLRRRTR